VGGERNAGNAEEGRIASEEGGFDRDEGGFGARLRRT
jgi:hypothetical protein